MNYTSRNTLIAESLIRDYIRKRISLKEYRENKVRKIIRTFLLEAEAGTEEPSEFTGINVLANVLEKVIPIIERDYKMLTTSAEQRDSFRNHIMHAIKNSLKPIEAATSAEDLPENFVFEISRKHLIEKISIDLDAEDDTAGDSVEGEFIDIDKTEEEDEFVQLDDQNETGRNFAATTFKQVEKQIIDAYDMLADEEDQKLFYDYLLTNMLLYFDKFEDELTNELPNTTTPEYEQEKDSDNIEEPSSAEIDDPFAD
jgi:hypothetical protein